MTSNMQTSKARRLCEFLLRYNVIDNNRDNIMNNKRSTILRRTETPLPLTIFFFSFEFRVSKISHQSRLPLEFPHPLAISVQYLICSSWSIRLPLSKLQIQSAACTTKFGNFYTIGSHYMYVYVVVVYFNSLFGTGRGCEFPFSLFSSWIFSWIGKHHRLKGPYQDCEAHLVFLVRESFA